MSKGMNLQTHSFRKTSLTTNYDSFKMQTFNILFITLATAVAGVTSSSSCPPFPASMTPFSYGFKEPKPPAIKPEYQAHFVQHKWWAIPSKSKSLCILLTQTQEWWTVTYHSWIHPKLPIKGLCPSWRSFRRCSCLFDFWLFQRHQIGLSWQHLDYIWSQEGQTKCLERIRELKLSYSQQDCLDW